MSLKFLPPKSKKICTGNPAGFALIEVLIAMVVLALALLAAATMQLSSIRNNTSGNLVTHANMLAKAKMEELKNTPDVTTLDSGDEVGIDSNGQPGGIYNRSWEVENIGYSARRLTVTVEWNHLRRTRRIVISSNTRGSGI